MPPFTAKKPIEMETTQTRACNLVFVLISITIIKDIVITFAKSMYSLNAASGYFAKNVVTVVQRKSTITVIIRVLAGILFFSFENKIHMIVVSAMIFPQSNGSRP